MSGSFKESISMDRDIIVLEALGEYLVKYASSQSGSVHQGLFRTVPEKTVLIGFDAAVKQAVRQSFNENGELKLIRTQHWR